MGKVSVRALGPGMKLLNGCFYLQELDSLLSVQRWIFQEIYKFKWGLAKNLLVQDIPCFCFLPFFVKVPFLSFLPLATIDQSLLPPLMSPFFLLPPSSAAISSSLHFSPLAFYVSLPRPTPALLSVPPLFPNLPALPQ